MIRLCRHFAVLTTFGLCLSAWLGSGRLAAAARVDGRLTLTAVDEQTGQPLAVRMELRDRRGRPVRVRGEGLLSRDGYVVFDGEATLPLRKGEYTFLIEAGPEYETRSGEFSLKRHAEDSKEVVFRRLVNMHEEGWWAADLDVDLPVGELPLLSRAAAIDFAPCITQQNLDGKCEGEPGSGTSRLAGMGSFLDHRRGGPLLFLNPSASLNICKWKADGSSLGSLTAAHESGALLIAASPTAWDLPLWIATGKLDAINTLHRSAALQRGSPKKENQGRPRDQAFFPGKQGAGRYSEAIYHHLLNCGLRLPPAAGSGAGASGNPLGTNRVYAYCGEEFSAERWRDAFRAGRVVVTSGPLLRTSVSGKRPGHIFQLERGETRDFQIALSLTFYELSPVEYLEIVKNGRVLHEIRLDDLVRNQGRLPPVPFEESGWFLVRARTSKADVYQYASTGPYYVEANYQHRISRGSVRYFLDWLQAASEEFADNPAVVADIQAALPFWQDLLAHANAD